MAIVKPFRGVIYNTNIVGNLSLNLCPPFDAISSELQKDLLQRSPFNIVRLECMRRHALVNSPYRIAEAIQQEWINRGILLQDHTPTIYVVEEEFEHASQCTKRRGLIAAVKLQNYSDRIVFPHERTRKEWVEDRFKLMQSTQSVYSPLLTVVNSLSSEGLDYIIDQHNRTTTQPAAIFANLDNKYSIKIWKISDPNALRNITRVFKDSSIIIADGHHRYEASLKYKNARDTEHKNGDTKLSDPSYNYRMALLIAEKKSGLITQGYHRSVAGLTSQQIATLNELIAKYANVSEWKMSNNVKPAEAAKIFEKFLSDSQVDKVGVLFGCCIKINNQIRFLKVHIKSLETVDNTDYIFLHKRILEPIGLNEQSHHLEFHYDIGTLVERLEKSDIQMAFIMRPLPLSDFFKVAEHGQVLPAKVTNFYPKPPAGSVIQLLNGEI